MLEKHTVLKNTKVELYRDVVYLYIIYIYIIKNKYIYIYIPKDVLVCETIFFEYSILLT